MLEKQRKSLRLGAALLGGLATLLSVDAGAVTVPTVDPTRVQRSTLIGAEALAKRPVGQRTPAERAALKGFEALMGGDASKAEASFQAALVADPTLTAAYLGLADLRVRQRRPDDALAFLERAQADAPRSADVRTALGRFYYGQGQTAKAKAAYLEAIRLDPQALLAHVDLADLYATAERSPPAAAAEYRKALAINADFTPARVGLGMALLAGGDSKGAISEFQRAARDAPDDPTAWHLIGRVYAAEERYAEAAEALSESLRAQPDFLPALMDRADVYAQMDEDRKAAADYERIATRRPDDAVTRVKLGMIHQRLGESAKAEADYRSALSIDPDLALAANNLAMITLRSGGNLDEALGLARKAVAINPSVPQFHDTLGAVYRARGAPVAAIDALEKATSLPPPQAEIWYHLGQLYDEGGRVAPAVQAYRRALEVDPGFADAAAARARIEALGR